VCCIPDFGKVTGEGHARLLAQMFRFLVGSEGGRKGWLPTDWVARQVDRINRTDGDIETLMQRIASVRTWTYVAHRGGWLDDAEGWQQRTRAIEDKLSDALHQRLIQRFVDRRTASLVGRMQGSRALTAAVNSAGEVLVEGHFVGMLEGFRFAPDPSVTGGRGARDAGRSVTAAAVRALGDPIRRRIDQLEADVDDAFMLDGEGGIRWRGALVARLRSGRDMLAPRVEPVASDLLGAEAKLRVVARLTRWLRLHLRRVLAPLFAARETALSGPARGLLYQIAEALGSLPQRRAATQIAALPREDRKALAQCGLRLGRESIYYPRLLKHEAMALRALLWSVHGGVEPVAGIPLGRPSLSRHIGTPEAFYEAAGYRVLGERAVRVDIVEQVTAQALRLARKGTLAPAMTLARLLGCADDALASPLFALGYRLEASEAGVRLHPAPRGRRPSPRRREGGDKSARESQSPFAALEMLRSAR
jgi:ATP-dependent RNA helicase SUPV3L1/SUV3